jgi:hypothetical protein
MHAESAFGIEVSRMWPKRWGGDRGAADSDVKSDN